VSIHDANQSSEISSDKHVDDDELTPKTSHWYDDDRLWLWKLPAWWNVCSWMLSRLSFGWGHTTRPRRHPSQLSLCTQRRSSLTCAYRVINQQLRATLLALPY